jgi:hypothetical protein
MILMGVIMIYSPKNRSANIEANFLNSNCARTSLVNFKKYVLSLFQTFFSSCRISASKSLG